MVEASRIYKAIFARKPKVLLDNRFQVKNELNVGDKGQLLVDLSVISLDKMFEEGTEYQVTSFMVNDAKIHQERSARA